jgi:hypothetical protein
VGPSIFLDFHLPNAATWFYFSTILTVCLFFQFARPFCLRNLDLLSFFILAPGFLLLQEAHSLLATKETLPPGEQEALLGRVKGELLLGYIWILAGSVYWFVRVIIDLSLVRRPALSPNLTTAGLACFGLALFAAQGSVAMRHVPNQPEAGTVGRQPRPLEHVQDQAFAVVQQTQTGWGSSAEEVRFWVERSLAMCCHSAVIVGLLMIGLRHFQDKVVGIGMATLYLLVPYTAYHIGQLHHVWPTAFLVWAFFCYRRPITAGWLLGLAAGTSFFPAFLFPLWAGFYSRRGTGRFGLSFLVAAALSLAIIALVSWWDGDGGFGFSTAFDLSDWQPWRDSKTEGVWRGEHWAYRLPIFILFVAFLSGITIWPRPKNLSHLIALSAGVLIGIQFWYGDRGGVYVLWYMPLLILMVFRPNLAAAEPPVIVPGGGLMGRMAVAAWRRVRPGPSPPKELAV